MVKACLETPPQALAVGVHCAGLGPVAHVAGAAPGPVGVAAPTARPVPLVEHACSQPEVWGVEGEWSANRYARFDPASPAASMPTSRAVWCNILDSEVDKEPAKQYLARYQDWSLPHVNSLDSNMGAFLGSILVRTCGCLNVSFFCTILAIPQLLLFRLWQLNPAFQIDQSMWNAVSRSFWFLAGCAACYCSQ